MQVHRARDVAVLAGAAGNGQHGVAGVDGINLLAYRYDGDVPALVRAVSEATTLPFICAGSVDSVARIEELRDLGVWAFTIGTAALDGVIVEGAPLEEQLSATLAAAG